MPKPAFAEAARGREPWAPTDSSLRACLFAGDRLVLAEGAAELPTAERATAWIRESGIERSSGPEWFAVAGREGAKATAARVPAGWAPPAGAVALGLRSVLVALPEPALSLALAAAHLVRWRRTSRFAACAARRRRRRGGTRP